VVTGDLDEFDLDLRLGGAPAAGGRVAALLRDTERECPDTDLQCVDTDVDCDTDLECVGNTNVGCPRPTDAAGPTMAGPAADAGDQPVNDEALRQLLLDTKVIAVVGLSANPDRPSNQVAWYLHHQGYRLFGVNPSCPESELFGVPMVASLAEVPEPIDIVDVFRRPEHTPDVARDAVAAGARVLWLQLGIRSDEARAVAEEAGLTYVEDRCVKVDHARLLGR
jgi:predicted CoA-binding protein